MRIEKNKLGLSCAKLSLVSASCPLASKIIFYLGKGSKSKLIIFAEFSAKGGWEVPAIRENNYFFHTKEIAKSKSFQNALKHVIK